jgi:hypothetical protein
MFVGLHGIDGSLAVDSRLGAAERDEISHTAADRVVCGVAGEDKDGAEDVGHGFSSVEGAVVAREPCIDLLLCHGGERFVVAGLADAEDGTAVFGGESGRATAATAVANVGLDFGLHWCTFLSGKEVEDEVGDDDSGSNFEGENESTHVSLLYV